VKNQRERERRKKRTSRQPTLLSKDQTKDQTRRRAIFPALRGLFFRWTLTTKLRMLQKAKTPTPSVCAPLRSSREFFFSLSLARQAGMQVFLCLVLSSSFFVWQSSLRSSFLRSLSPRPSCHDPIFPLPFLLLLLVYPKTRRSIDRSYNAHNLFYWLILLRFALDFCTLLFVNARTMMETQELVVPKSIPITSPASSDFHLFCPPTTANLDENAAGTAVVAFAAVVVVDDAAAAAVRRRNDDVVAVNIVVVVVFGCLFSCSWSFGFLKTLLLLLLLLFVSSYPPSFLRWWQ